MLMTPIPISDDLRIEPYPRDNVCYQAEYRDGRKELEDENTCYGRIMSTLGQVTVTCKLYHRDKGRLPSQTFTTWIEMCRQNHLIPFCTSTWTDDEGIHHLFLPKDDEYDRADAFGTLCCFRWADSYPGMVWQIIEHVKVGIHFWQALHYGCAKHFRNTLHSFMKIDKQPYSDRLNMGISVAAKAFFQNREIRGEVSGRYISDRIGSIALPFPLNVPKIEQLLETELGDLYEMVGDGPFTTERNRQLKERFNEIMGKSL